MCLSVIIPCHNMADTLARAVESALNEADEILLYDDGSSDDTTTVCWDVTAQSPNVRYLRRRSAVPIGVCGARNILISNASGKLIVPLDADDAFLPGGITALREAHQEGSFVYGGWRDQRGDHTPPPIGMLNRKNVAKATFCFEKRHWLQVGGYNPLFNCGAEDYAFMLALVQAGIQGIAIDFTVYEYTDTETGRAAKCKTRWPLIQNLIEDVYGIRSGNVHQKA
jgi:glycosyltransferase involved in cell wall biosynthesis